MIDLSKSVAVVLVIFSTLILDDRTVDAASKYPKCHMIELEKCFDKLHALKTDGDDPIRLLTSDPGITKLCRIIKQDFVGCVQEYIKKCGTPLHKEMSKLISDAVLDHMNPICDPKSNFRNETIEHTGCIHDKVSIKSDYRKECNNPFFVSVAWGENKLHGKTRGGIDSMVDATCCGYRSWEKCASAKIKSQCNAKSDEVYFSVISKLLGDIPKYLCYSDVFEPKSKFCLALPSLEKRSAQANLERIDKQKFSFYSILKMFLVRDLS